MKFQDLSKRFVTSMISLIILVCILTLSSLVIMKWLIALLTCCLASIGIWEFGKLSQITSKKGLVELCMAVGSLVILGFFVSTFNVGFSLLPLILLCLGVICVFLYHFDQIAGATHSIASALFGICYVALPLGLALKVLYLGGHCLVGHDGRLWLLYLLVVTKVTDIGAYFGGRLFGRKRLAPELSPGKTISGAIIGFCFAVLFSLIFSSISSYTPGFDLTWLQSVWLGALLGFLGQVGDLAESLLKRDADVKDSNRLPGLGGVLDMLDSLLFTIPVVYFFLYVH